MDFGKLYYERNTLLLLIDFIGVVHLVLIAFYQV